MKLALKKYWERPDEFEEYSLFKLYLTHKFKKGRWKRCEKENIVRILPHLSALRNGAQWEDFCRVKIIFHVPHRSFEQLNEDSSTPWSTIYNQHIDRINSDLNDLLEQEIEEEIEISD